MGGKLQVCPQCKGVNLSLHLGGFLGMLYRCGGCGYVGPFIIEMSVEEYERLSRESSD
ncbi:MAG: hypothetical protein NXY59_04780 [Aigarchaeota archaeon]|nr:hypothetical protein [Candidatus Pelearchaeum maunauluense]